MEEFLLKNTARYNKLVNEFKPPPAKKTQNARDGELETTSASPDITVCARIRPMLDEELSQGFPEGVIPRKGVNSNTVDLHEIRRPVRGPPGINSYSFTVDKIFPSISSTSEIYSSLLEPLVPWAWAGGVSTLFAYGQTSSGKTFTVSGLERLVADTLTNNSLPGERKLFISIIELAGQSCYDLLNGRKKIAVLEDSLGNTQLAGAAEHFIPLSPDQAEQGKATLLKWIDTASALRCTEPTKRNDSSSRSHSICRIRIENPAIPEAEDGLLFLVDLAGSEAARDKEDHDAARMKEAREINSSLSVLKDCIRGRAMLDADNLAGKVGSKKAYVPFRQSALTKTLKHVFDPSSVRACKTVVVACVNPCAADVGASKNTLRYAEMLSVVLPISGGRKGKVDPGVPASWDNETLRVWIGKNSGTPPVSSALLAPFETGPQLIRLPVAEFIGRCMKTEGVSLEQAQAFQSKFWRLHFDSSHRDSSKSGGDAPSNTETPGGSGTTPALAAAMESMTEDEILAHRMERLESSEDIETDPAPANSVPFKERIRPGMVVRCNFHYGDGSKYWRGAPLIHAADGGSYNLFVVLCPAAAVGDRVRDVAGEKVKGSSEDELKGKDTDSGGEKYLCSIVSPGLLPGSYVISLWRQVVVGTEDMDAEVLMEHDVATRYYYLTV
ncbi:hypothetical protein V8F06_005752 [Rhypophila decipiens]